MRSCSWRAGRTRATTLRKLDAVLDQLCTPVGDARDPMPPLLTAWKTCGRQLQLTVSGAWLDPGYAKVPLPLPTQAVPLALYLFCTASRPA